MDDIEELRRALGPITGDYNETQLRQLSGELDLAAEFLLDLYAHTRARRPDRMRWARFDGIEPSHRMKERSK